MDEWNVKWRPVNRIVPSYKKDKKINKVRDGRTSREIPYMKKREGTIALKTSIISITNPEIS